MRPRSVGVRSGRLRTMGCGREHEENEWERTFDGERAKTMLPDAYRHPFFIPILWFFAPLSVTA